MKNGICKRGKPFDALTEDRWLLLIAYSAENRRLTTNRDDDQGPDLGHSGIHKSIFRLLEMAPVTTIPLNRLYGLLLNLNPEHIHHPEKIDHVLERWSATHVNDEQEKQQEGYFTSLSLRDEFRCLIGAVYGKSYSDKKITILGSSSASDVAERCAYYGNADLTAKEMQEGKKRDGQTFVFAALLNDRIYHKRDLRKLFEEDFLSGGALIHRYRSRCEQVHQSRSSFDPKPLAEWLAPEADGKTDLNSLEHIRTLIAEGHTKVSVIGRKVRLIGGMIVSIVSGGAAWFALTEIPTSYGVSKDVASWIAIGMFVGGGYLLNRQLERA